MCVYLNVEEMLKGKKLLVLGGKPIGSVELVQRAQELGAYVIVADYLSAKDSPAKRIADEHWEISTAEVEQLAGLCRIRQVDGVLAGVHEFNINRMLDLCEILQLPCYCKRDTWIYCDDKVAFKTLCLKNEIPVAKKYSVDNLTDIQYPVIVKPVDGSGSRGFHICNDLSELKNNYQVAKEFSPTGRVIIEDYIPYDAVIIQYTVYMGKCYFSGMSDKISCRFESTGASVMGFQSFPSKGLETYLKTLDAKVCKMFEKAGFTDGPIWIEAFYDGNSQFFFNEMGYRFGGSLTNYPVDYFYGINQLDLMIIKALGGTAEFKVRQNLTAKKYCILPIHIAPGTIKRIEGLQELKSFDFFHQFVPVHFEGDVIQDWGSAQQVFCYLHVLYTTNAELRSSLNIVMNTLRVYDEAGKNMLFTLFDFNKYL